MASISLPSSKQGIPPYPAVPSQTPPSSSSFWSWASPVTSRYNRFAEWRRESLGLTNPGTAENLLKEVKATHVTNFIFDGARADLTQILSMNPAFQVTHTFSLAAQTAPPQYNFGAVFANSQVFMQGGVDHDGNLTARFNYGSSPSNVTKMQAQASSTPGGHSMLQLEHDYLGSDFSLNAKAVNPSPTDFSGIYVGNYLQSITKNLAVGVEALYQRGNIPGLTELGTTYLARYAAKNWIATAQAQSSGILQTTYWQKLGEKLEVAADLQLIATPQRRDAIATVGAKYTLRTATFRAQFDSSGKVSALLEQQLAPTFAFLVAGEIDHVKSTSKVGVGIMIESSSLTPDEAGHPPQAPY